MTLLIFSWLALLVGALLTPIVGNRRGLAAAVGAGGAVLGCGLGLLAAVPALLAGQTTSLALDWPLPGGEWALTLDPLAAFFLVPIFLIGLVGAVYGSEYMATAQSRFPGLHWFFYNLLIISMTLVVTAAHSLLFLLAWEGMSLASFFLVIGDHRQKEARRAGFIYLTATHLGATVLFGLFLAASVTTGSLAFASFPLLHGLSLPMASLFFLLALVGFGSKAGLISLHVWLPEAHPAAPSHVSALMSAVMVKTALYGLLRFLTFLPPAPAWWGTLLMVVGIAGALFGIAMAALQRDIKQGLAYSTVENVGIILLALGAWLYAAALPEARPAAALALIGALLHIWNHALFKGLLFLGAGSLLHGAGTRNLDRMGGLLRRMPVTGLTIVGGCLAVAALPPGNGLVGEWYIYLSLLVAGQGLHGVAAFFPLVLLGLFALIGGMALIVFTRLVGIALCGEPRTAAAAAAHESGWRMRAAMGLLVTLCFIGGLAPLLLLEPLTRVLPTLAPALAGLPPGASMAPLWLGRVGALLVVLALVAVLIGKRLNARRPPTTAATWGCGFPFPTSRMAYSAEGYAELAANSLMAESLRPIASGGRALTFFPGPATLSLVTTDPFLDRLCEPLFSKFADSCTRLRRLQSGNLYLYILYIFVTTGLLLIWAAFSAG